MSTKLQRFYHGCTFVLRSGFRVSGEEVEVLLGHGIHILGLNRQLACIPFSLYQFIHQNYSRRVPLWKSAAKELRWMRDLLPFAYSEADLPWSGTYFAYDASLGGFGVCRAEADPDEIAKCGRMRERYRYKGAHSIDLAPRAHSSPEEVASDTIAGDAALETIPDVGTLGQASLNGEFRELPAKIIEEAKWSGVHAARWRPTDAHITALEMSTRTWVCRMLTRCVDNFGKRFLLCGDNLATVLSCDRGRGTAFCMISRLRRAASYLLPTGIVVL